MNRVAYLAVMGAERPLTKDERAALRARGLRPRTFWLPDANSPEFLENARLDCEYLWRSVPDDVEAMAWAEAMTDEMLADLDRAEGRR
ncbi:antitoxin MazE-like protein [uncultured Sphingomonas sp.]|uniref:antitoxin MazE-like protein n=1 Tax=uncultured Sphingomonas sp. TaxID=158754 RepID=UPI0035C94808